MPLFVKLKLDFVLDAQLSDRIEKVLPGSVIRKLSEGEMVEYRRPFSRPEDRWPTLTWPRQIQINGEPSDVAAIVSDYASWLAENTVAEACFGPANVPSGGDQTVNLA